MLIRDPDAVWAEVGDELFILGVSAGRYFICKGIGPFIWKSLETPMDRSALVELVVERYAVGAEQAGADIDHFIGQLEAADLVSGNETTSTVP